MTKEESKIEYGESKINKLIECYYLKIKALEIIRRVKDE